MRQYCNVDKVDIRILSDFQVLGYSEYETIVIFWCAISLPVCLHVWLSVCMDARSASAWTVGCFLFIFSIQDVIGHCSAPN
jgi:hypothetical protein